MTAFRILAAFVLGGILGLITAHLRFRSGSWKMLGESLKRYLRDGSLAEGFPWEKYAGWCTGLRCSFHSFWR
jgi:hypothetical protein